LRFQGFFYDYLPAEPCCLLVLAALLGQKHLPRSGEANLILTREFDQLGILQSNHLFIGPDPVPAKQSVHDNLDWHIQPVPQHVQDHQPFIIDGRSPP